MSPSSLTHINQLIPQPTHTHPMVTYSQNNIFKPKKLFYATSHRLTKPLEPTFVTFAFKDPKWHELMVTEYAALI